MTGRVGHMTGSAYSHDRKHKLAILPHSSNALAVLGKVAGDRKQLSQIFQFLCEEGRMTEEEGGGGGGGGGT